LARQTLMPLLRQMKDAGLLIPLREASGRRSAILDFPSLLNIVEGRDVL